MDQLDPAQSVIGILAISGAIAVILVLVGLLVGVYAYYRRRLSATVADAADAADLAAHRDLCVAEIEQAREWMASQKDELLRLEAERQAQERLRAELSEVEVASAAAEQKADDARKEVLELQQAATSLADTRSRLAREIDESNARLAGLQSEVQSIEVERKSASEALSVTRAEAVRLKAEIERQEEKLARVESEMCDIARRRNLIDSEVKNLEIRQQTIQSEIARLASELAKAQAAVSRAQADLQPMQDQIRERLRLDAELKGLRSSLHELEQREAELKEAQRVEITLERYSDLFSIEPAPLADDVFSERRIEALSEDDALAQLGHHLDSQGLVFSKRVLNAFHTCLKINDISPITVLAGVSGTGKSELPLRYAEAMGMHRLSIAVQPSWSSPQDLFGFYNYLEKRYKATELARALVRMDPYNFSSEADVHEDVRRGGRQDRMLLVLVDEMNLARVEYYFSEFLSKLEARRAVSDPSIKKQRAPAEVEIEGAQRLWVGNNVLFVGTMNEDESTQTLSDKVLDRANVLRFGRPPDIASRAARSERTAKFVENRYLPYDMWKSWIRPVQSEIRWKRDVNGWIEELNGALELIGRPFGWRVKQAIHEYIANYPGISGGGVYKTAMADQVEQKILPKLRGVDVNHQQSKDALVRVETVLQDLDDRILLDAIRECQEDAMYGTFNWRGVTREA